MSTKVGDLSVDVSANLAKLYEGLSQATTAVNNSAEAMRGGFDKITSSITGVASAFSSLGGIVTAFGATLGVGAFAHIIESAISGEAELYKLAQATGATVESLSAMRSAAAITGTSMDNVGRATIRFAKNIVDAQAGTGKAAAALEALGFNARTFNSQFKTTDEAFLAFAQRLSSYGDAATKANIILALLGRNAGQLAPFIKQVAAAGLDSARVTTQQAEAAEHLEQSWNKLGLVFKGVAITVANTIVPVLQAVADNAKKLGEVLLALVAAFVVVPAVVGAATTALEAYKYALINVTTVSEFGTFLTYLFSVTKTVESIKLLFGSLGAAIKTVSVLGAAAFAGWTIGNILQENIYDVKIFGILVSEAFVVVWENIKAGFAAAWEFVKYTFEEMVENVKAGFSKFLQGVGAGLTFAGLGDLGAEVTAFGKTLDTGTGGALVRYKAALANITYEAEQNKKAIRADSNDIIAFYTQQKLFGDKAKGGPPPPPPGPSTKDFHDLTGAVDAYNKAYAALLKTQADVDAKVAGESIKNQQTDLERDYQRALVGFEEYQQRRVELQQEANANLEAAAQRDVNVQLDLVKGLEAQLESLQGRKGQFTDKNKEGQYEATLLKVDQDLFKAQGELYKAQGQLNIVRQAGVQIGKDEFDILQKQYPALITNNKALQDQIAAQNLANQTYGQTASQIQLTIAAKERELLLDQAAKGASEATLETLRKQIELRVAYAASIERSFGSLQKEHSAILTSTQSLKDQVQAQQLANETYGLTAAQVQLVIAAKDEELIQYADEIDKTGVLSDLLREQISVRKQLAGELSKGDDIQRYQQGWSDLIKSVNDGFSNFFQDLVNNGTSAFKNLWANFKAWALEAIAKIAAQQITLSIVGGLNLGPAAGNSLLGAGGPLGNILGGLFGGGGGGGGGGLGSIFGLGGGGGSLYSAFATSGIGQSLGLSEVALGSFADGVAGAGAGLTAMGTALAGAIPIIGGIAIAGAALYSFLKSKEGGPKEGGFAASGTTRGTYFPGESTPEGDAAVKQLVDSVSKSFQDALKQLGGKSFDIGFALGYDTDPKGKALSNVHGGVYGPGGSLFENPNPNVGRSPEDLQAELQHQAQQMLLAALQASDLPGAVGKIIGSVDVLSATTDDITAILQTAEAIKAVTDAFPALDTQIANLNPDQIKDFIDALGGADKIAESFGYLQKNFTTTADQTKKNADDLSKAFTDLGLQVPTTHKAFTDLLASFDLTTDSGRQLYASVIALAPAFVSVAGTADDVAKQLQDATAFFKQNFYTGAEQSAAKAAEATKALDEAQKQLGITIPRSIEGFRALVEGIDQTTPAGQALYAALLKLAPTLIDLTGTLDDVAAAAKKIEAPPLDYLSERDKLSKPFEQQAASLAGESTGNYGDKLGIEMQLITGKIVEYQRLYHEALDRGNLEQAELYEGAIVDLGNFNNDLAAHLARFTVLTAQYGDATASQLVDLEDWYSDQKKLFTGNTDALAALDVIFHQKWDAIIKGTADGVDGTIDNLDKLRKAIQDYLDSLNVGDLSPATPAQKLAAAQSQYQDALAKAAAGDPTALQDITKFADQYLKSARDFYASSPLYTQIFNDITAQLEALAGGAKTKVPPPGAVTNTAGVTGQQQIATLTTGLAQVSKGISDQQNVLTTGFEQQQQATQVSSDPVVAALTSGFDELNSGAAQQTTVLKQLLDAVQQDGRGLVTQTGVLTTGLAQVGKDITNQPALTTGFEKVSKGLSDQTALLTTGFEAREAVKPIAVQPIPPVALQPIKLPTVTFNIPPVPPIKVQPIPPVTVQPIPPVAVRPIAPITIQPVKVLPVPPITVQPVPPLVVQPIAPVKVDPIPPVVVPPVKVAPIDPVKVEPVPPIVVKPVDFKPIPPLVVQPIEPVKVEPIQAVPLQPISPVAIQPIPPVAVQPIAPVAVQPIQAVPLQPVPPLTVPPLPPVAVQPIPPVAVQPIAPVPLQPVPPVTVAPIHFDPIPVQPIPPIATQPINFPPLPPLPPVAVSPIPPVTVAPIVWPPLPPLTIAAQPLATKATAAEPIGTKSLLSSEKEQTGLGLGNTKIDLNSALFNALPATGGRLASNEDLRKATLALQKTIQDCFGGLADVHDENSKAVTNALKTNALVIVDGLGGNSK